MAFNKLIGIDASGAEAEPAPWVHRYRYGEWHIERDGSSLHPAMDWAWWHDSYDGTEDANDNRCGREPSLNACVDAIDDFMADAAA